MLHTNFELKQEVDNCVLKMATAKQETFWKCFAEIMLCLYKIHGIDVCDVIRDEAHLRLGEFESAWKTNLYNRRILK